MLTLAVIIFAIGALVILLTGVVIYVHDTRKH